MTRDAQQTAVHSAERALLGRHRGGHDLAPRAFEDHDRAAPPAISGARGRALDWCVILGHPGGHEPVTPRAA